MDPNRSRSDGHKTPYWMMDVLSDELQTGPPSEAIPHSLFTPEEIFTTTMSKDVSLLQASGEILDLLNGLQAVDNTVDQSQKEFSPSDIEEFRDLFSTEFELEFGEEMAVASASSSLSNGKNEDTLNCEKMPELDGEKVDEGEGGSGESRMTVSDNEESVSDSEESVSDDEVMKMYLDRILDYKRRKKNKAQIVSTNFHYFIN